MPEFDKDAQKEVIKEALIDAFKSGEISGAVIDIMKEGIKEWMTEMFAAVGKWTVTCFCAAAFLALVWVVLLSQGWTKK